MKRTIKLFIIINSLALLIFLGWFYAGVLVSMKYDPIAATLNKEQNNFVSLIIKQLSYPLFIIVLFKIITSIILLWKQTKQNPRNTADEI